MGVDIIFYQHWAARQPGDLDNVSGSLAQALVETGIAGYVERDPVETPAEEHEPAPVGDLEAMPWQELRQLAASLDVKGRSRDDLIAGVRERSGHA